MGKSLLRGQRDDTVVTLLVANLLPRRRSGGAKLPGDRLPDVLFASKEDRFEVDGRLVSVLGRKESVDGVGRGGCGSMQLPERRRRWRRTGRQSSRDGGTGAILELLGGGVGRLIGGDDRLAGGARGVGWHGEEGVW